MAEMELGYGSEYQLMRFLGHHRNELNEVILQNKKINQDVEIQWLDYPKDSNRKSLDGEYKGINFLPVNIQDKLTENWKKYWPQTGNLPNWDAILYCSPYYPDSKIEGEWIVVEAKAHFEEMKSSSGALEVSRKIITKTFEFTQKRFKIQTDNSWLNNYYQLANSLAFINFLLTNGINASLLNIYFINGWSKNPNKNVTNK